MPFEFQAGEAYAVSVLVSSAKGSLKDAQAGMTVLQRNVHKSKTLRMKSSIKALSVIENRFGVFPFSRRFAFASMGS